MPRTRIAVALALGGLATSCLSVLGIEDLPRHESEPVAIVADASPDRVTPTPITYVEPACAVCVAESCFSEESACRPDLSCASVSQSSSDFVQYRHRFSQRRANRLRSCAKIAQWCAKIAQSCAPSAWTRTASSKNS